MPDWTPNDLRLHYQRAKEAGWLKIFEDIGKKTGVSQETLMAIASKETGMQNILTHDGHCHGVMGIDDHEHWKFLQTHHNGMYPDENIEFAASLLQLHLTYYKNDYRKAVAAYKVGTRNVDLAVNKGQDPDQYTPGRNYGKDVLARAEVIREIRKFEED
jgi:soluble lytic murein transglycosylase-like protein